MPWKETCAMEIREEFVLNALEEIMPFASLCRDFGVSRKTGYKWLERFDRQGRSGLIDGRTLRVQHLQYCDDIYQTVLELRRIKPTWGPKKLSAFLCERFGDQQWPSPSTIKLWLRKEGLANTPKRRRIFPLKEQRSRTRNIENPNDLWCADFKGWFRTGDNRKCEPLTMIDAASRYLLACHVGSHKHFKAIKCVLERLFAERGRPAAMITDNGAPFGSCGLASLSPMTVWLIKQGVWPEKTRPGHPQDNGRLERFHRTLKAETASPPAQTLRKQLERFKAFRNEYNNERPHESLGQRTPASCYTPDKSKNRPAYEYPASMRLVRVNNKGYIKWGEDRIYLAECLGKEHVGMIEEDEQLYRLEFLGYPLARIEGENTIHRL